MSKLEWLHFGNNGVSDSEESVVHGICEAVASFADNAGIDVCHTPRGSKRKSKFLGSSNDEERDINIVYYIGIAADERERDAARY